MITWPYTKLPSQYPRTLCSRTAYESLKKMLLPLLLFLLLMLLLSLLPLFFTGTAAYTILNVETRWKSVHLFRRSDIFLFHFHRSNTYHIFTLSLRRPRTALFVTSLQPSLPWAAYKAALTEYVCFNLSKKVTKNLSLLSHWYYRIMKDNTVASGWVHSGQVHDPANCTVIACYHFFLI